MIAFGNSHAAGAPLTRKRPAQDRSRQMVDRILDAAAQVLVECGYASSRLVTPSSHQGGWTDRSEPETMSGMVVPSLQGRERESRVLDELIDGVKGHGGVLIVRGEAGIGKSAILAEASRRAKDRGMTVLAATGVQSEASLAFAGLHQLLHPILGGVEDLPAPQREAVLYVSSGTGISAVI